MQEPSLLLTAPEVTQEMVEVAVAEAIASLIRPSRFCGLLRPSLEGYVTATVYDDRTFSSELFYDKSFGDLSTDASSLRRKALDTTHRWRAGVDDLPDAAGANRYGIQIAYAGPEPWVGDMIGETAIARIKALVLAARHREQNSQAA